MVYVQLPTYKVQQLACIKICKQISCFLTQLTVTADRIHTSTFDLFLYTHLLTVLLLPDTSIEKENDRQ